MLNARRRSALQRERSAAGHIPYAAHVSENVVSTVFGDYLQVFRLAGGSFESADDEQLNNWHERLNVLWRNLASPSVALWTHVIRRRERSVPVTPARAAGFAAGLTARYAARLGTEILMVNELYLAVLLRPAAGVAAGIVSRAAARRRSRQREVELREALDACSKLAQTVRASLARYEPEPLGVYLSGRTWCSSLLEFLGELVNGESRRVPLPRGPLNEALATTRLLFGTEAIEYRLPTATRVGAILGIKEYPTPTCVGMYNRLLSAPFALILTQSFTFLTKASAQGLLQRQFHRMANAGDLSRELAERYKVAVDLAVHAPRPEGGARNFHAHLLTTTRAVTPTGLGAKTGLDMQITQRRRHGLPDARQEFVTLRERWATLTNEFLRAANLTVRVDHRSLAAQGIDREPVPSIPIASLKMERRGVRSTVAERLRAQYRERVQRRLERAAEREAQGKSTSQNSATREAGSLSGGPPRDLEEIRRQAREEWRRLRTQPASAGSERGQAPTRQAEREGREREVVAGRGVDDDAAL